MNHWNLFKESWRIFWRNPALWLFGLLAALGGGLNLRYSFSFNFGPNFDPDLFRSFGPYGQPLREIPPEVRALLDQLTSSQAIGTFMVIGIVWAILAFLLATYADGALISMVNAVGSGQKVNVSFGFRAGARRFLHLLAVRFLLALPALILAIITGVVASQLAFGSFDEFSPEQIFSRSFSAISGLSALSFVVGLLMMAIGISAERAVVIDELPIWPSVVKGWKFLWGKFGDYFTIVLLLIGLAILAGIILACVLTPILCGVLGVGAASSVSVLRGDSANILAGLLFVLGPLALVAIVAGLLFSTLANVFTSGVWTLAYRQWTQPAQPAEAALPPTAPPAAPIEPPGSSGPSSVESTPEDKA